MAKRRQPKRKPEPAPSPELPDRRINVDEFLKRMPEILPPPPPEYPPVITGAHASPDPNVSFPYTLWTRDRLPIKIGHALEVEYSDLFAAGSVDAFIVSTEEGYSPLGLGRQLFTAELGIPWEEIKRLADWNRFENERVTLIPLASRREGSHLKGIILAPGASSRCYQAVAGHAQAETDFYYNVTYQAIAYASGLWSARRLALTHLSESRSFHQVIAATQVEALAHFCDQGTSRLIATLLFVGCCIKPRHLQGLERSFPEPGPRPAQVEPLIHLSWP